MQRGLGLEDGGHLFVGGAGCNCRSFEKREITQDAWPGELTQDRDGDSSSVLQYIDCIGQRHGNRWRRRSTQKIALTERDAEIAKRSQVVTGLDALCDQCGPECFAHGDDGTDHFEVLHVAGEIACEELVELDELRLELRPTAQVRMTVSEIVQRQSHAGCAQRLDRAHQRLRVGCAVMLGQLDHELARIDS